MDDLTTVQLPSLSEKQALERVISFAQRFGPPHMDLASHAAFPLVLSPDLLYRIWASFLPQIPWTTVSDILLSPLCREVGYELYEMDLAIRDLLLRELKEDDRFGVPRLKELAGFLEEYIALNLESNDPDQQDLAQAQHLTALAYTAPDEAARQIAQKISDPSQLAGADLLRIATLTETLSPQLQEYSGLVSYARGVERLAHGDRQRGSDLLERAFEGKPDLEIAGVTLSRPRRAPEPVRPPAGETAPAVEQETKARAAPNIFISYRRAESKYVVDRIRDRLTAAFGEGSASRDLVDIPLGENFDNFIEEAVSACDVMLVVIGSEWANATDARGRKRLFDPDDLTRIEIESALAHPQILVIPVLVMNANMPGREDLPESLHGLLFRNAVSIRSDPDFATDMERLIQSIRELKGPIEPAIAPFEPETVYIPEGSFLMGSLPGEGIPAYETPQHEVFLPAYRIGKYPVTNAQYEGFVRETGRSVAPAKGWNEQRIPEGMENHPVIGVTRYDALAYCRWLSQKTGREYTLPNEAQWEKACRGGSNFIYPWGDEFDPRRSNANQPELASVDNYPAQNDFGCFDLVGNVTQWTSSLWGKGQDRPEPEYSYPWRDDGRNDIDADPGILRVVRGSGFQEGIQQARSSARRRHLSNDGCGFRVVMIIDSTPPNVPGSVNIGETINIGSSFDTAAQTSTAFQVTRRPANPAVPRAPRLFIGRTEELERLRQLIQKREKIVLTGIDGIGKSSLLRQVANSEEARAMPDGVIWIDGVGSISPDDLIQRIFDSVYESNLALVKVSLEGIGSYLTTIQALVVVDGLQLPSGAFNSLADLMPGSALLLSSTRPPAGDRFRTLPLGPLPAGDAIQLFMELAGPSYENADVSAIDSICRLLGSVPLAIAMTTSLLQDTQTSLELVHEVLAAAIPQSRDESAAGLERARELVSILGSAPAEAKAEQKAKLFICYKVDHQPDQRLAEFLSSKLSNMGHSVYMDKSSSRRDADWLTKMDEAIRASDLILLVALSDVAAEDEMIGSELSRGYEYRRHNGKPRNIAILGANVKGLPDPVAAFLDPVQSIVWRSERDNERVARELVQAIQAEPVTLRQRLAAAARDWEERRKLGQNPPGWGKDLLDQLPAYNDLTKLERQFLEASQAASQSQTQQQGPSLKDIKPAALPDDLVNAMRAAFPSVREGAVQELASLLTSDDPGLARAAREALERMAKEDDSRRVSQAATQALEASRQASVAPQETSPRSTRVGIVPSNAQQAAELLQKLKSDFQVDVRQDWGESDGVWQPGTWTMTDLERLQRTLVLMATLMGGNEAFIRNLGGVSVRKADIGTHGGEALSHQVSFSTRESFSAWTVVHQFAHAWDANYRWALSRELEKYTGGSTSTVRSLALRLTRNWDAGRNGPKQEPGRRGRLPGCNQAGYFYGDQPSGSNWSFNRVEDFAESVTMYVGWERGNELSEQARDRIARYTLPNRAKDAFGVEDNWADYRKYFYPEGGDYTRTKRWQFIDDLVKGKI